MFLSKYKSYPARILLVTLLGWSLFAAHIVEADINDGLIAYWSFDNCDAVDATGNGNDGTIQGSPQCVDSTVQAGGKAFRFQGTASGASGDHILLPEFNFLSMASIDGFSVCLWVNEEQMEHPHGNAYVNWGWGSWQQWVVIGHFGDEGIMFATGGPYENRVLTPFNDPEDRYRDIHYCLVHDKSGITKGYKDFNFVGGNAQTVDVHPGTAAIARHWWTAGTVTRFTGTIDEVRVYNRALSDEEIALFNPLRADAGPDQSVNEGVFVTLDGSASSIPPGGPPYYHWTQLAGVAVSLDQADPVHPTFTAPYLNENDTLTFQLIVGNGADCDQPDVECSDPDTVDVTVIDINSPPVVDAGDDYSIKPGREGALDASNTYDPDGIPLNDLILDWSQVSGNSVTLDLTHPVYPAFAVPDFIGDVLIFKLIASDGIEWSIPSAGSDSTQPDTVAVTIVDNAAPEADAGEDQTRDEGSYVTLSGTASDPDDDPLTQEWNQIGGTNVGIDGSTTATVMFEAPPVSSGGEALEFEFTVDDNDPVNPKSTADQMIVNVRNINDPPSCDLAMPSSDRLWPPSHKMIQIDIEGVMDQDSIYNSVALTIISVTQDEPVNGQGDGDSSPDAVVQSGDPSDTVLLRAERAGSGNGRVYQINFVATDGFESCDGSVQVVVPHDRKDVAVDDGQIYDSTLP